MSNRKIEAWHAAGLIDEPTAARLIAYETEHARPLALWAVFGIGALAIGLGLVSIVAANWEDIPGQVRLGIHFALFLGGCVALALRDRQIAQASPWASEALLFVLAVLALTFFGHLGQVYQTSAPLWEPLALWLALTGPMMLLYGRGWPVAALLAGGAVYCVWEYNYAVTDLLVRDGDHVPYLRAALVTALPILFAPAAAWMRGRSPRSSFWKRLEQLAFTYAVVGASMACVIASVGGYGEDWTALAASAQLVRAAIVLLAGIGVLLLRRTRSGQMAGTVLAGAALVIALARDVDDVDVLAAGLFMLLWIGIAGAALVAGWRGVFQLAVAVVAFRLIVLSFELASDLLLSGFGLVIAGLMILLVAFVAVRISRQFAPQTVRDDGESAA